MSKKLEQGMEQGARTSKTKTLAWRYLAQGSRLPVLFACLGAVAVIGVTAVLDHYQCLMFQKIAVQDHLEKARGRLVSSLDKRLFVLDSLAAYVSANPTLTAEAFDGYAMALQERFSELERLELLRQGQPLWRAPSRSLDESLGKNGERIMAWWPLPEGTVTSDEITLAVLGGQTAAPQIIGARPVFTAQPEPSDNPQPAFWGYAIAHFQMNKLLADAMIDQSSGIVLFNWEELPPETEVPGDAGHPTDSAPPGSQFLDFSFGSSTWRLTAYPKPGWSPNWPGRAILWFAGLALAPTIGGLIFIFFSQPRRLRKAVDRAIEAQEDAELRFRAIFDNSPTEIYLKDTESRLVLANRQMKEDYGSLAEELIGKTPLDLFPAKSADEHLAHDHAVMLSGQAIANEYQISFPGGVRTQLSLRFPIRNKSGEITTIGAIDTDITDRKAIEEALIEAKNEAERAAQAKSRFVASASHDLRQPLAALKLMIYDLSQSHKASDLASILNTMTVSADAMTGLIDNFLDLTKLEIGGITTEFQDFGIDELLEQVAVEFEPLAKQKALDLRVVPCSLTVQSDFDLLARIVKNLVANAIRYTEKGRVVVGCRRRGLEIDLQVWDSGPGIEPDEHHKIFDEFYQVAERKSGHSGTLGLGLSIAHRSARLLDTQILLESEPGKGSVFSVRLPLGAQTAHQPDPIELALAMGQQGFDGVRLLLIDDDDNIRVSLARLLQRWGAEVTAVSQLWPGLVRTRPRPEPSRCHDCGF